MPDTQPKPPPDDELVASSNLVDAPGDTDALPAAATADPAQDNGSTQDEEQQSKEEVDELDELVAGVQALHVAPSEDAHPQLLRIARLILEGTGLYSQLEKYNLPAPEAVFEINFFRRNPKPFYMLAKELWPGNYAPTPTHYFMRLLHDKGLLLRCYTQNIDSLEAQAGLPRGAVVAAHGNFDGAHCARCRTQHDVELVRQAALREEPLTCREKKCTGVVKPEIVFFGESLPETFHAMVPLDFSAADLLIVMGTSLVVNPFASLIHLVDDAVPRLLINRELVGEAPRGTRRGFDFSTGSRDGAYVGDCDDAVQALVKLLGWEEELHRVISAGPRSSV